MFQKKRENQKKKTKTRQMVIMDHRINVSTLFKKSLAIYFQHKIFLFSYFYSLVIPILNQNKNKVTIYFISKYI